MTEALVTVKYSRIDISLAPWIALIWRFNSPILKAQMMASTKKGAIKKCINSEYYSFSSSLICLTREKEDQADSKEVRVLSQTRRIHAEVSFAETLNVSSYHLIECTTPSPSNRGGTCEKPRRHTCHKENVIV